MSCKQSWLCPTCVCSLPKQGNSNTPARNPLLYAQENCNENVNSVRGSRGKNTIVDTTIKDLILEIRDLREEIKDLKQGKTDINLIRQDVQELKDHFATFSSSISQRFIDFQKTIDNKDKEIDSLKLAVSQLKATVNILEHNNLKNEIEICGIPEENNESLAHLVLTVSQKISVPLQDSDISDIIRAGPKHNIDKSSTRHRPIVVKLTRKSKRDEFLTAAKSRKNITSENIVHGTSSKIFINERVTKDTRMLFREARTRAQHNGFRFCWLRNGSIFIRKDESTTNNRYPAIRIHSLEDLDKHMETSAPTATIQSTTN